MSIVDKVACSCDLEVYIAKNTHGDQTALYEVV